MNINQSIYLAKIRHAEFIAEATRDHQSVNTSNIAVLPNLFNRLLAVCKTALSQNALRESSVILSLARGSAK